MGEESSYDLLHGQEGRRRLAGVLKTLCCVGGVTLFLLIGMGIGIAIGYFVFGFSQTLHSSCSKGPSKTTNASETTLLQWGALLRENGTVVSALDKGVEQMNAGNIEDSLKRLTALPHIAGQDQNSKLADEIYDNWTKLKFDKVERIEYSVLLQYPNDTNPNKFQIVNGSGDVLFDAPTAKLEPALTVDENQSGVARPFNAYSGSGSAQGPLVYVNYARLEDFQLLDSMSINVSGCVCIARYGITFRGSQAMLAEQNGCLGLVLYSDPGDFGPKKGHPPYPQGESLPPSGIQRGSVKVSNGDPLTPLRPAIANVYRRTYEEALANHAFPSIPVTPLSSSDAYYFLSMLDQTTKAPDSWQGGLNFTYHIGPGFNDENKDHLVYIEVNNYFENRTIVDVVGTIYGSQEPDRPVLLGNHRDAWVFGAVDAAGGTATMLEIARSLDLLRATGWRPGRSIMLCSWDASEYCMIGSVEFAEDRAKQLLLNAVAYLNVDLGVSGNDFILGRASPLLIPAMYEATKKVQSPKDPMVTIYDEWLKHSPDPNGKPVVNGLAAGSDYTVFLQNLGISSLDYSYENDEKTSAFKLYPMYHSIHDSFTWLKSYVDFNLTYHLALGAVWLRTALHLATSPIVPFGVVEYGDHLHTLAESLNETYFETLQEQGISLDFMFTSIESFKTSAQAVQNATNYFESQDFNETTSFKLRRVLNSKLLGVERSFLVPEGLPERPFFKHVVFAPNKFNSYVSSAFPGITDSIFEKNWSEVKRQISIAALSIRAASNVMLDGLDAAIYNSM